MTIGTIMYIGQVGVWIIMIMVIAIIIEIKGEGAEVMRGGAVVKGGTGVKGGAGRGATEAG